MYVVFNNSWNYTFAAEDYQMQMNRRRPQVVPGVRHQFSEQYEGLTILRTPVEIWTIIIRLAVQWSLVPAKDDFALRHYQFATKWPPCHLYHAYMANERLHLRMRLVCRSWNTVIMAMVLVDHFVLAISSADYWPSQVGISRAICIQFGHKFPEKDYSDEIPPRCSCKSQTSTAWRANPAAIPYPQEESIPGVQKDLLVDLRSIEASMLVIRGGFRPQHAQLVKIAPLLQALSLHRERALISFKPCTVYIISPISSSILDMTSRA